MANFQYLGEVTQNSIVNVWGPLLRIDIPKKDGTFETIMNPVINNTYPVLDPTAIDFCQNDPRFLEV